MRHVDQARVELRERCVIEAQPRHCAALEVFAEDVGAFDEAADDLDAFRIPRVDRDTLLVAVEHREKSRTGADQLARVVAGDRLDSRAVNLSKSLLGRHLVHGWDLALVEIAVFDATDPHGRPFPARPRLQARNVR